MMSVTATFKNYSVDSSTIDWICEFPFIKIKGDKHESVTDYISPPKKSNRGRKKKIKQKRNNFKSNISFILNNDTDSRVKNYNIRVFNGGRIVCVGVLREDKSDFYYCIAEVRKYLIRQKLRDYPYNLPREFFEEIIRRLEDDFSVHSVASTLENYQFHINYFIDIFRLKDYFVKSSEAIININFDKLYNFLTKKLLADDFALSPEALVSSLEIKGEIKREFVSRDRLVEVLKSLDLADIKIGFSKYWNEFTQRAGRLIPPSFGENVKFSFLKQYFITCFEERKKQLMLVEYSLVENVRFKESKHTLILEKKKDGASVTVRIFSTGTINIQGGNSRIVAEKVYEDLIRIFHELSDQILILPDKPPLVDYETFL